LFALAAQLVGMHERAQMHFMFAAQLAQQVVSALQNSAVRWIGDDLRDEQDAHQ
jgi:hypothetical protein